MAAIPWGVIIPAAVTAGTAILQYINSQEASKLSANERKRLEAMAAAIQSPSFDPKSLTPEDYKVVSKYVPEVASFVEEVAPQTIKMNSADAKLSKDTLRGGLQALKARSESNVERDLLAAQGQAAGARQANAASQTLAQELATRGQSGSGMEMLDRLMAMQQGSSIAAQSTQNAELENQRAKLQALKDSLGVAQQIRGNEFQEEGANTDIINSFNQRTATRKQNWADSGAAARSDANRWNATNEQDIGNKNVGTRNQSAVNERDRQDRIAQNAFGNEMERLRVASGQAGDAREDAWANAAQNNQALGGLADAGLGAWAYMQKEDKKKEDPNNPLSKTWGASR